MPDFELAAILSRTDAGSARCWLSPSVQVQDDWLGRTNRTAWMHCAATDDIRDEIRQVLGGPGIYIWVLPIGAGEGAYRFLHVGKASRSIEARQKVHLRHACSGTDPLWYPTGNDIEYGRLECRESVLGNASNTQRPPWDQLERHLSPVRILCISLAGAGPETLSDIDILESALLEAAVAHFAKRPDDCGWRHVSNTKGKVARTSSAQAAAAKLAINRVLPLLA